MDVLSHEYAQRMVGKHRRAWRGPSPSKWDLRRLRPGYMLDIGCGIGRQLKFNDGHGVGVDPNVECVEVAKGDGLVAFTPDEFDSPPQSFDSILIAHVLEHISRTEGVELIERYLPYLKRGGQVILLTPQEKGYASDPTHVRFVDLNELRSMIDLLGLRVERAYSFPLPRWGGRFFIGNEFRLTARQI